MKHCSIEDCEKRHYARGWCKRHYDRWRKHGDPLGAAYQGPEAAFLAKTEPLVGEPAHTIWKGATDRYGYGSLRVNGRSVKAHRYAWERANGPIPDGMFIDHACHERSCVNPDHLRLATPQQNQQNRSGARSGRKHDLPRGVTRRERGYQAQVQHNGKRLCLGTYDTPELASQAAETKRAILFGEFAGRA